MFETLTDRLNETFARLGRKGRLTEQDVDDAMREVRRALLEADVNFKVAKDFVAAVRERAVGTDVLHARTAKWRDRTWWKRGPTPSTNRPPGWAARGA